MEASDLELFARSVQQATSKAAGAELDAALAELGWLDALVEDRPAAVSVVFEHLGLANTTAAALEEFLTLAMGLERHQNRLIVLPLWRDTQPPGMASDGQIVVQGVACGTTDQKKLAVVAVAESSNVRAMAIPLDQLQWRKVSGLDPSLGLSEVSGTVAVSESEDLGRVDWFDAVAMGQLALGHELVGTSRTMLDLARTHALERMQFGRPIASFQAVRHRLAEGLVAIEAAAALLSAAWEEPTPMVAAMAKGMAGRSARTVTRHTQQVLAGIGFTTEHPLHLYVRRALVLDQMLGAGTSLTRQLGSSVLSQHALPATFSL